MRRWLSSGLSATVLVTGAGVAAGAFRGIAVGGDNGSGLVVSAGCGGAGPCREGAWTGLGLLPGGPPAPLPVTFANYRSAPVQVRSLSISFTNSFPSGCPAPAFRVSGLALSGQPPGATIVFSRPVIVPAASRTHPGKRTYPATLALVDNGRNQDRCRSLSLTVKLIGRTRVGAGLRPR